MCQSQNNAKNKVLNVRKPTKIQFVGFYAVLKAEREGFEPSIPF